MKRTGITLTKELYQDGKAFAEKGNDTLYLGNVYRRGALGQLQDIGKFRGFSTEFVNDNTLCVYSCIGKEMIQGHIELSNFEIIEINE